MERWSGRVALVTGAGGGVGAGVSKALVKYGMKVVGCDINTHKIEEIAEELSKDVSIKGLLHVVKCDLTNEDDILSTFAMIKEKYGGVDAMLNVAGHCYNGGNESLLEGNTSDWKRMLDVNVIALSICSREAFKQMKERNVDDGHIIHTNSVAGHRVRAGENLFHFYAATKYAVTALTEGLRQELRELKSHIRISSISPGTIQTDFNVGAFKDDTIVNKMYQTLQCLKPEDIADAIIYAMKVPPHVQVHDLLIRPTEMID